VLASVGSVGDAYDNALAESFVDGFKTELIADRVWRTRAQRELYRHRSPSLERSNPQKPVAVEPSPAQRACDAVASVTTKV
jgi:hypothetical protein